MKIALLVSLFFVSATSSAFARNVVCTSTDVHRYQITFESENMDVLNDVYVREAGNWELAHRTLRHPMQFKRDGKVYKGYFSSSIFPRDSGAAGTGNFLLVPPQMPATGPLTVILKVDVGGDSFHRVFEDISFTCN